MGFIGFVLGTVLVVSAFSTAGIGAAALAFVLWVLFGFFMGLPPLIGLLMTWRYWAPNEALAGLTVQALLFVGAIWIFQAAGLGDLTILFVIFSAINGVMMVPAMVKEKQDQLNKLDSDGSD